MTEKRRRTSDHRVGSTQFHQQNKRGKKQQEHEAFSQNDEILKWGLKWQLVSVHSREMQETIKYTLRKSLYSSQKDNFSTAAKRLPE